MKGLVLIEDESTMMHQLLLVTKQQDWKASVSSASPLQQNTLLQAEGKQFAMFFQSQT